jgi:predicted DNA-binding transcriptional regulator AlpA
MEQSNVVPLGGASGNQTPSADAESDKKRARLRNLSPLAPVLLTDVQVAELWGISQSFFYELRKKDLAWFPQAVQLSPKVVRYLRTEAEAAALHMPRQVGPADEPARLRRGRIARMKAEGVPA